MTKVTPPFSMEDTIKILSDPTNEARLQRIIDCITKEEDLIMQSDMKEDLKSAHIYTVRALLIAHIARNMGDLTKACQFLDVIKGFIINMEITPITQDQDKVN